MNGLDAYYDGLLAEYQRKIDEQARLEEEACKYCGGNCPNDEDHACDGYLGDIDGLYQGEKKC
jgi:hypothetical protein